LNTRVSLPADWPVALKAACERLLHPSAATGAERARQLRLLGVLLVAPFFAAVATMQIVAARMDVIAAISAAALVFGLGLLPSLALIATAKPRMVDAAALAFGAAVLGTLLASSGGITSPLVMMSVALVFEAGWVGRTRKAAAWGLVASVFAVVAGGILPAWIGAGENISSAWQWVLPLFYATTLVARWPLVPAVEAVSSDEASTFPLEEMIGAASLRLQKSGEVVHASPKAEELLGVVPEMLLGSGLFDRIHVTDRIAWLSALSALRADAAPQTVRLRLRVRAEEGLPVHAAYRNFICDMVMDRRAGGIAALLREDPGTAALEEALAETRRITEVTSRSKDEMLAAVSHELRTPLNAVVGFADMLSNEMFGRFANEKQREYVELIREAGNHLLSVVNTILDVSKVQSGTYGVEAESFRFEDAVRLSVAMTAHQAQAKSVNLRTEIADDIGTVHCDRRAIQQVLINLLSNAVKFTPAGEVALTASRRGDRLEFTVSDTGIGISAEDLELLGTPFMQVRNDYTRTCQGTGLGLALVKGLVRLQGGGLSIESAPGMGTRVHVSLPAGPAVTDQKTEDSGFDESGANWNGEWYHDTLRKTA